MLVHHVVGGQTGERLRDPGAVEVGDAGERVGIGAQQRGRTLGADHGDRLGLGHGGEHRAVGDVGHGCRARRAEASTLEGGGEVGAGRQAAHEAMDRADGQLVVDQLDHEHHRGVGRPPWALVGPSLVPVGERGLVAVVAIGDHHR